MKHNLPKFIFLVTKVSLTYLAQPMHRIIFFILGLAFCGITLGSCAHKKPKVWCVSDREQVLPLDYQDIIEKDPVSNRQDVKVHFLGKTKAASYHLVQVRTQEALHIHRYHDATATVLSGKGLLKIGRHTHEMREGDVTTIPRKHTHGYINQSKEPSVLYVVFSPPFDGKDRVVVKMADGLMK